LTFNQYFENIQLLRQKAVLFMLYQLQTNSGVLAENELLKIMSGDFYRQAFYSAKNKLLKLKLIQGELLDPNSPNLRLTPIGKTVCLMLQAIEKAFTEREIHDKVPGV
jgi:hypothetical protein